MNLAFLDRMEPTSRATSQAKEFVSPPRGGSLPFCQSGWLLETTPRVAGPSRRPAERESTQIQKELSDRKADLEVISAIKSSRMFTEFQRAFTEAFGLPVSPVPVESFQLCSSSGAHQGSFCGLMARESRTCGACLQAQSQVAQGAREQAKTASCYAGLCETVVPLRLGSRLVGFLRTGQVFRRKPTERQFQRTLALLRSWGMNLDENALRRAYFETRVVSRQQHEAAVTLLKLFAEHLVMLSNQILIQRRHSEPTTVTRAKQYIREHYAENLRLAQVARLVNSSPFHFCKIFKRATGLTFTKFVCRVRIESCKGLLINPQLRVSEIAYDVGFRSLSHFNRVFQKMLGQSPTEYRLSLRRAIPRS